MAAGDYFSDDDAPLPEESTPGYTCEKTEGAEWSVGVEAELFEEELPAVLCC